MITSQFDPHALQNYDYFSRPMAEIHPIFEPKPLIKLRFSTQLGN